MSVIFLIFLAFLFIGIVKIGKKNEMDIKIDFKTIVGIFNIIVFIIIVPLLKYIWSNHVREEKEWRDNHSEDAKEFRELVSDSVKDERKFSQEVFTKHDKHIAELFDRTKDLCTSNTKTEGDIKMIKRVCDERHGKS